MDYYVFLMGMALGIILMTAIYNTVLYYYNREKPFLYYALMQLGMMGVLFYDASLSDTKIYEYISLFALFFIVMFADSFLEITAHLQKYKKIVNFILWFIVIDALIYPIDFIFDYGLYIFIFIFVVYIGYLRVAQGSKSAKFYMFGWSAFLFFVLIDTVTDDVILNPMYIGSVMEAIILAIALSYRLNEKRKEQIKQKKILIQKSKLASMGELLGNIAHQWRQPLTRVSYILMNIKYAHSQRERTTLTQEATEQLEYMSQTINDFTNFYAPDKEKEFFSLSEETQLIVDFLDFEEIAVELVVQSDATVYNYKNEFKQVLLNLFSNAKDILKERATQNPNICIVIDDKCITIGDNAGGIKLDNLEQIFEPYFTTKEGGIGIGLYMCKLIIEKNMEGTLSVVNTNNGAMFTISLP
jgi:signal transduction histidine kinase